MTDKLGYLPDSVVAGATIWIAAANPVGELQDITLDSFSPDDGYTLAYQFAADTPISVSAVANGANTGWTLEVTGAQTLLWAPGSLTYAGIVTHTASGRTFSVDLGTISVNGSPMRVSQWKTALTACDAAIASYAANPHGSFNVGAMSVTYRSLSQLTDLREWLKYMVSLDNANRPRRIVRTRFT
jgi:hypothetical protein